MTRTAVVDAAVTLGVVLLDRATKAAVLAALPYADAVDVLGPYVRITHVRNVGAAFGLLASASWASAFFTVVTAAAVAALVAYRLWAPPPSTAARLGLQLVLGGAIGNLIDRLRYGHVVDFIDAGVGDWRWPAFNVADSAITVGVICLLVAPARKAAPAEADGAGGAGP